MPTKSGKLIVLTGCTRGLGRALLDQFVAQGHTVLGCGRSQEAIEQLTKELGTPHAFTQVDVSEGGQVEAWAAKVLKEYGAPDLLINNAAVINETRPLWEVPVDEFDRLIDINIKGVFHVVRAFVPAMVKRQHGVIVNFSSGWGRSVDAEVAPYCCSKWGVEGLTLALAEELPKGMAAIPLNPGVIDTDMLRSCWQDAAANAHKPTAWAKVAAAAILAFGPEQNGQQLAISLTSS